MDFYEAFAHTWGSTGTVDESLTTTQYDQGWNFIGARPPRLGEFNKREKLIDQRLKWLYDQLKTAADAHGVTLSGSDVGGLLAMMAAHEAKQDPHPAYLKHGVLELSTVPSQKVAPVIIVTKPHLRVMVWDGTRYVRAPWHQPCQLFFSYDNPASIPGALPVRADVSYQQSNYPDLVDRLGLSGSGTFTLAEARGEFIRVLDNGRGVDAGRAVRSFQEGTSISQFVGRFSTPKMGAGHEFRDADGVASHKPIFSHYDVTTTQLSVGVDYLRVRPRNVAYPLWITY